MVEKLVVNCAVGKMTASQSKEGCAVFTKMFGRKPWTCLARKSVAKWGIRKGMHIGFKATFRGRSIDQVVSRLVWYILPSISSFNGLASTCLQDRCLSFGIGDVSKFMVQDSGNIIGGFNVNVVAKDRESLIRFILDSKLPVRGILENE